MKTLNQLKCKQKKLLVEQWNDDKEMKKKWSKKKVKFSTGQVSKLKAK
jgi:hypothetical protein